MLRHFFIKGVFIIALIATIAVNPSFASDNSHWTPLLDVVFEKNDLEMAVLILVNDNNIPVSDIIVKAREMGFGYTRIVDALVDTKLSCEQVVMEALQNNVPPKSIFDSGKICGSEYNYTPESILRLLVDNLRFIKAEEESLGKKEENIEIKEKNMEIILRVCRSMMADKDFTKFDIIYNLCQASASNETIGKASERFDVSAAIAIKACPRHAEYGKAYISHELPEKAHIVTGVTHLTIDDDAGRGVGVISPKRP